MLYLGIRNFIRRTHQQRPWVRCRLYIKFVGVFFCLCFIFVISSRNFHEVGGGIYQVESRQFELLRIFDKVHSSSKECTRRRESRILKEGGQKEVKAQQKVTNGEKKGNEDIGNKNTNSSLISDLLTSANESLKPLAVQMPVASDAVSEGLAFFCFIFLSATMLQFILSKIHNLSIPVSVIWFLYGMITYVVAKNFNLMTDNPLYKSIINARNIDSSVLYFILLPILLYEATQDINYYAFKNFIYGGIGLAVVGVALQVGILGFLFYYSFMYAQDQSPVSSSFLLASVLSSTDPVAVLSILSVVDAPSKISSMFHVESLINDGSSVLLFQFFFYLTIGYKATASEYSILFIKLLFLSPVFGIAMALLMFSWINMYRKYYYNQCLATITMCYLCYFISEYYFNLSGPLAIVCYGLFINAYGHIALDEIAQRKHKEIVELLALMGNSSIFIISGIVSFGMMESVFKDNLNFFLYIFLTYVYLLVARAVMILIFTPFLSRIGYKVNWKEILLLIWGGLRGGIVLVLALRIEMTKEINDKLTKELAYYISGSVLLILTIQGLTFECLYKLLNPYPPNPFRIVYLEKVLKMIDVSFYQRKDNLQNHWLFKGTNILHFSSKIVPELHWRKMDSMGNFDLNLPDIHTCLQNIHECDISRWENAYDPDKNYEAWEEVSHQEKQEEIMDAKDLETNKATCCFNSKLMDKLTCRGGKIHKRNSKSVEKNKQKQDELVQKKTGENSNLTHHGKQKMFRKRNKICPQTMEIYSFYELYSDMECPLGEKEDNQRRSHRLNAFNFHSLLLKEYNEWCMYGSQAIEEGDFFPEEPVTVIDNIENPNRGVDSFDPKYNLRLIEHATDVPYTKSEDYLMKSNIINTRKKRLYQNGRSSGNQYKEKYYYQKNPKQKKHEKVERKELDNEELMNFMNEQILKKEKYHAQPNSIDSKLEENTLENCLSRNGFSINSEEEKNRNQEDSIQQQEQNDIFMNDNFIVKIEKVPEETGINGKMEIPMKGRIKNSLYMTKQKSMHEIPNGSLERRKNVTLGFPKDKMTTLPNLNDKDSIYLMNPHDILLQELALSDSEMKSGDELFDGYDKQSPHDNYNTTNKSEKKNKSTSPQTKRTQALTNKNMKESSNEQNKKVSVGKEKRNSKGGANGFQRLNPFHRIFRKKEKVVDTVIGIDEINELHLEVQHDVLSDQSNNELKEQMENELKKGVQKMNHQNNDDSKGTQPNTLDTNGIQLSEVKLHRNNTVDVLRQRYDTDQTINFEGIELLDSKKSMFPLQNLLRNAKSCKDPSKYKSRLREKRQDKIRRIQLIKREMKERHLKKRFTRTYSELSKGSHESYMNVPIMDSNKEAMYELAVKKTKIVRKEREGELYIMIFNTCRELYKKLYVNGFISGECLLTLNAILDLSADFAIKKVRMNPIKAWADAFDKRKDKKNQYKKKTIDDRNGFEFEFFTLLSKLKISKIKNSFFGPMLLNLFFVYENCMNDLQIVLSYVDVHQCSLDKGGSTLKGLLGKNLLKSYYKNIYLAKNLIPLIVNKYKDVAKCCLIKIGTDMLLHLKKTVVNEQTSNGLLLSQDNEKLIGIFDEQQVKMGRYRPYFHYMFKQKKKKKEGKEVAV